MTEHPTAIFLSAAESFADIVRQIPPAAWHGPGLGEWDLRSLVGHTSRSLITVSEYLQTTAEREDIAGAQQYYAMVNPAALGLDAADVAERGRRAGRDLGADPAAAVDALLARVRDELDRAGNPLIEVIGGHGIRLHSYLTTRTFELAVHGLDIVRAAGIAFALPDDVLAEAATLAAGIGVALGQGQTVLLSLTGRMPLPASFSVV